MKRGIEVAKILSLLLLVTGFIFSMFRPDYCKALLPYTNTSQIEQPQCSPATRIVFLKTHKTGGSTISSILGRYAYRWNLKMPRYKTTSNGVVFTREMLKGQTNLQILASHTIYNRPEMDFVFGDALYVTILREPAAQFESSFDYFNMAKELNIEQFENAIEEFMRQPVKYMNTPGFHQSKKTLNDQFRILGLPKSKFTDKSFIRYKLKQLEYEFDLVMINEYFDESLILLQKLFCWQFDDILYLSKKIRSKRTVLSKILTEKIRSWNSADVLLYDYFNRTFWRQISEFGDSFFVELDKFRKMKMAETEMCVGSYNIGPNVEHPEIPVHLLQIQENLSQIEQQTCTNLNRDIVIFMQMMDSENQ